MHCVSFAQQQESFMKVAAAVMGGSDDKPHKVTKKDIPKNLEDAQAQFAALF